MVEFHAEVPRAYAVELIFEGPLRLLVEDEDWDLSTEEMIKAQGTIGRSAIQRHSKL